MNFEFLNVKKEISVSVDAFFYKNCQDPVGYDDSQKFKNLLKT